MLSILLLIHTVLCLTLIGLVLIQQGKGADMGAAFGGGSNTVFGAGGAADFITRLTTGMAIAFMVSSIFLVKAYSSSANTAAVMQSTNIDPLAGSVMEGAQDPNTAAVVPTGTPNADTTVAVPAPVAAVVVESPAPASAVTPAQAAELTAAK